ncbi:hypothetical protein [Terrimonas pollutisoli]|uniref:hypothetical protein n=1 Tax=Terrimonas pollutisoli TaxID=3034147 RepID=UPI0023EC0F69|nr:hypothetical protein [Terrimonas sp. H1YJ31]
MKHLNNLINSFALVLLIVVSVATKAQTQAVLRTVSAENKVAILPITYVGEGNDIKLDEMRYRLQNIAHDYLRSDATEFKFQDPAETNALLRRNGVNESNFREFTPKELAGILRVEYVLMGIVSQEFVGETTVTRTNRRDFGNRHDHRYNHDHRYDNRHHHRNNNRTQTTGHSRTRQELSTNIDLDIYNDKGENIFSKSRRSILSGTDAYKYGIQYLLKRSPLYKR